MKRLCSGSNPDSPTYFMKPEWNKIWKRWEILDSSGSCEGMRGLEDHDLQVMADEVVRKKGYEPGLHEDWVDDIKRKLRKKYKIQEPIPMWIEAAVKELCEIEAEAQQRYEEELGGETYSWVPRDTMVEVIRKHAPKT